MKRQALLGLASAFALAGVAQGAPIFSDDFQAYSVSNPSDFSATGNWVYNGFAGDGNTNRIFNTVPNYGTTQLWITAPGNIGAGIDSTGFAAASDTDYVFTANLVMETNDATRTGEATVDILVGATLGTATSVVGGPQTFAIRGDDDGGAGDNSYSDQISTLNFNSGTVGGGDLMFISIVYSADTNNAGFAGVDNVVIDEVPEPGSLALMGLGGLALLRRRRK